VIEVAMALDEVRRWADRTFEPRKAAARPVRLRIGKKATPPHERRFGPTRPRRWGITFLGAPDAATRARDLP